MLSKTRYLLADYFFSHLGGIEYYVYSRPSLKTINIKSIISIFWSKIVYNWHYFKKNDDKLKKISIFKETLSMDNAIEAYAYKHIQR